MNYPTVLIIDDNSDTRDLLKIMLSKQKLILCDAESAKEGLKIILEKKIDVIILDMLMPGMRGFEFVKILRNKKNFTPIIAVSNLRDKKAVKYALGLGVDDYIIKPVDRQMLLQKINYYIGDIDFVKMYECEISTDSKYNEATVFLDGHIYKVDEMGISFYMNGMPEKGIKIKIDSDILQGSGINSLLYIVQKVDYIEDETYEYRYRVIANFVNEPDRKKLRSWILSGGSI